MSALPIRAFHASAIASLLICAVAWSSSATGGEATSGRLGPDAIGNLIKQLDDDNFALRERAAATLVHAGPIAINALAEGVVSENPEVAWRSSEVLQRMAMEGDEATMDRIVGVLMNLAKHDRPALGEFASKMRERQKAFRHNRAAAELRKLGGRVAGSYEEGIDEEDLMLDEGPDMGFMEGAVEVAEFEDAMPDERPAVHGLARVFRIVEQIVGREALLPPEQPAAAEADMGRPAVGERLADAVLPGRVGRAIQRALGEVERNAADAVADMLLPPQFSITDDLAETSPSDFRLPPLDEDDEYLDEIAMDEVFPGEEMEEDEEIELAGIDVGIAAPVGVVFGGFMVPGIVDSSAEGVMWLSSEWRGGDAGLKYLKDLSGINSIQIEHAELTDAALPHIARLASLKHLQIRGGKFSREALRAFHRQKPDVSIMALGEGMMGVNGAFGTDGCVLDTVFPTSAAHEAGLQPGDQVTAINGEEVKDFSDLTISVSTCKPGDKLKIAYKRDQAAHQAEVTLKPRGPGQ